MDFGDSFFEDLDECDEGNDLKPTEKVLYTAKRCEPEWFLQDPGASDGGSSGTQETENHMLLKFRADFLYYRKQYSAAVEVYHRILEILPPTNGLVRKEVTDSLTRCQLHLGGYLEALEYAKSLVLPPHARDSASWQLLAQCHQQLGNVEEQVLHLQKSAMLQRYQVSYWLQLSEGYEALYRHGIKDKCTTGHSQLILSNTVALFRPYFRWSKPAETPPEVWPSERHDGRHMQGTESLSRPHHGCPVLEDSGPESGNQPLLCGLTDGTACEGCRGYGDCGSKGCVQNTPVSGKGLSRIEILQSGSTHMHASKGSVGCVCPTCSPFCLIVGGKMAAADFLARLGELPCETAKEVLSSFYTMASCSCFIWARQLLLYSVRYSASFAREKQQEELKRVDLLLNGFHGNITKLLLGHFSQKSVFEDSSDKS